MRIFILILIFVFSLNAKHIEADYKISYGVFGKIAKANIVIDTNSTNYRIILEAEALRIAKALGGSREEYYESSGHIENGLFVTEKYITVTTKKGKTTTKRHVVKNGDITLKKFVEHKGEVTVTEEKLDYKAKVDLLSLYANTSYRLKNEDKNHWDIKSIGSKSKDNTIAVTRLVGKTLKKVKKELKAEVEHYLLINIHQKIFSSKEGALNIAMDNDGVVEKAVLRDVIFFGDITGTLVGKNIR